MKNLFLLLFLVTNISLVHSQTNSYSETSEITMDDCTYICKVDDCDFVTLYNKEYLYGPNCTQVYISTNQSVSESDDTEEDWFVDDNKLFQKCDAIWNNTVSSYVSEDEANGTMIEIYINPQTGRIADVVFGFTNFAAVASIPPEVYRKVEKLLKEQLVFTIKPEGKKVNYIYLMYN